MKISASVITVSDKCFSKEREDTSGPAIIEMLQGRDFDVTYCSVVPDDADMIKQEVIKCADEKIHLIITTGGTGLSKRDITPEATAQVIERNVPGISEAMRSKSMEITPRGCLSRGISGLRDESLIINLPGSKKAAVENLSAVIDALPHGIEMMLSRGSANCAAVTDEKKTKTAARAPSVDLWKREAQEDASAPKCGMYLCHNGVVRETAKSLVREGNGDAKKVTAMEFTYDEAKVNAAVERIKNMAGIEYVRIWLNNGKLSVGDDLMQILIGGDIRPHVVEALTSLVDEIKKECVLEKEIYCE